jgi:hypothetical protein
MGLVQIKIIQALFQTNDRPLKIVPKGDEAGIPLMHLLMGRLYKELTGLLLESQCCGWP